MDGSTGGGTVERSLLALFFSCVLRALQTWKLLPAHRTAAAWLLHLDLPLKQRNEQQQQKKVALLTSSHATLKKKNLIFLQKGEKTINFAKETETEPQTRG